MSLDPGVAAEYESFMPDFTPYQKKVIGRYYDHKDGIMLTRLGEIATELYLADSDAKTKRLWDRAAAALKGLKVPPSQIEQILRERKPDLLARYLRDLLASSGKIVRKPESK